MKVAVDRRSKEIDLTRSFLTAKSDIHSGASVLKHHLDDVKMLRGAKVFYASARIQGIIRGFLARFHYKDLLIRRDATVTLQSLVRGRLGRKRWMIMYWLAQSVVKSLPALDNILARSNLLRTGGAAFKHWQEYFDPMTNSVWYLNPRTKQNTWECPMCFQHELVCTWNGFAAYGGLPSQGPCRKMFGTVIEYHQHIKTAHPWHCPACGTTNKGMNFPVCSMCENTLSPDGEDALTMMAEHVDHIQTKLKWYMGEVDHAEHVSQYSLRKSMIDKSVAKRKARVEEALALDKVMDHMSQLATTKRRGVGSDMDAALAAIEGKGYEKVGGIRVKSSTKLPWEDMGDMGGVPAAALPNGGKVVMASLLDDDDIRPNSTKTSLIVGRTRVHVDQRRRVGMSFEGSKATKTAFKQEVKLSVPRPGDFDAIKEGFIPLDDFNDYIDPQKKSIWDRDDDDGDDDSMTQDSGTKMSVLAGLVAASGRSKGEMRLCICERFQKGLCDNTTCMSAHPGIRDNAQTQFARIPGRLAKVPYVLVCPEGIIGQGDGECLCTAGRECLNYHIYIRPSTLDIVRRVYPIKKGVKKVVKPSGAKIEGQVEGGDFNGYGTMTWPEGSVYVGDWCNGSREGWGIFTTRGGIQYVGNWKSSLRHGFGVATHPNGEEYVGEWTDGRMCGVGRLESRNGDVYEGTFERHMYHGVGTFFKANGDRYMGHFVDNKANGLGILALSTGEKYKGYFTKNARNGKGVCAYPNGCRYAGEWFMNNHEGFGIFVSNDGERYVGQWRASKKDGVGRYYFSNGDIYDGEFSKNLAKGQGIYQHFNGNIYKGQWDKNQRNGRGTYNFANGSKYTGYWQDNQIHGKGRFDYDSGSFYRGEYQHNQKHGRGTFVWPNGNTYTGHFEYDVCHGLGIMKYILGHVYTGMWAMSKKHGKGKFVYLDSHIYEGDWIDDKKHGKGKMTFLPGTVVEESYDGDWIADQKHGEGTYNYRADEGTVYEGHWELDKRCGFGKLQYLDGSFYRGDFKDEQMWGKGVYVGADGSQYDGEWTANMRHGKGTSISPNGFIYQGDFWKNMKQGEGCETRPDGVKFKGTWDCGIMVGQGSCLLNVGEGPLGGPSVVNVRVFSF